jgi:hypothetical protein
MEPKTKLITVLGSLFVITVVLTMALGFAINNPARQSITGAAVQNSGSTQPVYKNSGISSLSSSQIVKDLPEGSTIELKLGENFYTIQKNLISSGKPSNADVSIFLPDSYTNSLVSDFCETVKKADKNGDLVVRTTLSKASLTWKYRSMLKYKSCLGL